MRSLDLRVLGARFCMLAWLTAAWVLLWGPVEIGTVLSGIAVGLFVMWILPLPRVPVEGRVHPLSMLWLGLVIAGYLVRSSIHVAWLSVRPASPPDSAVLRVPMRLRSDFCLALAVNALNLMPGGIVVRIDPQRRFVYVHVLDAASPNAVRAFHSQVATIERLFIRAFERPEDWRPSPWHDQAYHSEEARR